ncbi:MAG TPA: GNAT family N-acetyltransferase [Rhodanobacteraceae bacterium]|nr:GNAT family N-acetyltransferase [Rhodanobacteraceae bacterium]
MAAEFTTRFLREEEYPGWAEKIGAAPGASTYARPDYIEALCRAAGGRLRVLVAERDGKPTGGITLYERRDRFGWIVWPRRLLYYNGIVLLPQASIYPSQRTSVDLQTLAAIERALTAERYARLRIKSRLLHDVRVFSEAGWAVDPTWTYVVDIADLGAARSRVEKNLRRLIGRCEEHGLAVEASEDFDAFFHLHEQTHLRKGAPLYLPRDAFRAFFRTLREKALCRLYHARTRDGQVAASQLVLTGEHPVTHTVAAGTDEAFLNLGASAFLRWKVFEDLAASGYQANDLTDAELNPVTHFKSQLGGRLELNLELARRDSARVRMFEGAAAAPARARRFIRRLAPTRKD